MRCCSAKESLRARHHHQATVNSPLPEASTAQGARGATLRSFEEEAKAYIVFDNEKVTTTFLNGGRGSCTWAVEMVTILSYNYRSYDIVCCLLENTEQMREGCKRIYVLACSKDSIDRAMYKIKHAVKDAVGKRQNQRLRPDITRSSTAGAARFYDASRRSTYEECHRSVWGQCNSSSRPTLNSSRVDSYER
eukprot:SAG11_NODE_3016_length_2760_cov_2.926343_2_plen_192_part_00